MLDQLTCEDFSRRAGETFRHTRESGEILELELVEAVEMGGTPSQRAPFSVVFRVPAESHLEQAIYALEHAEMGMLELFLVPLGPHEDGMRYEAVFT